MKKKRSEYLAITGYSLLFGTLFFIVFGVVTVLIPSRFFLRMTEITVLDYVFLLITSGLLGVYTSISLYQKKHANKKCTASAYSGGVFGFLGFGCSVCNKILVLMLGAAGVLTYIEPYRPFIGSFGVGLMSYAVYSKAKIL